MGVTIPTREGTPLARIVAKRRKQETYYYYRETVRQKLSPSDRGGKGPGSGPSRVVTRDIYLGTAKTILTGMRSGLPVRVRPRDFGLVMAAFSVVEELGVRDAVDALVPAKGRREVSVGTYLSLMVVAKACAPKVTWHSFGPWLEKTTLARHLDLPRSLLDAQNFWDAFDRLLPERQSRARLKTDPDAIWNDDTVLAIEETIWRRLLETYPIDLSTVLIDATNFFTYMATTTQATLPRPGHNKAGRHEKRQIALCLATTSPSAMPLVHLTYAGNVTDVRVFPHMLRRLVERVRRLDPHAADLTLVFDRGHNSKANMKEAVEAGAFVVGGLVASQHPDLLRLDVRTSDERVGDLTVVTTEKTVYGQPAKVVVTYNAVLERKQRVVFGAALLKLRRELAAAAHTHREDNDEAFAEAMDRVLRKSRVGRYYTWSVDQARVVHIRQDRQRVDDHRHQFGRRLLFTTRQELSAAQIVQLYNHDKAAIEANFRAIKSPDLVRLSPVHHFTDTKIRLYALVCVTALLVLKVMALKAKDLGLSTEALVQELADIQEAILVYGPTRVEHTIAECSTIQAKLVDIFDLTRYLPAV